MELKRTLIILIQWFKKIKRTVKNYKEHKRLLFFTTVACAIIQTSTIASIVP